MSLYIFTPNTLIESAKINANFTELTNVVDRFITPTVDRAILSDGSTTTQYHSFIVPDNYNSGDLTLTYYLRSSVNGNVVVLRRYIYLFRNGSAYTTLENSTNMNQTITAGANVTFLVTSTISSANFQAGDVIRIDVSRIGADAADTNTGVVGLDMIKISYTGTQM